MPGASRTEIEAKFVVPDAATFAALLALEELGDYRFLMHSEQEITDRYIDTPERSLFNEGYACRQRQTSPGAEIVVAVKGLGGVRGAVHRRAEHEMTVAADATPDAWPEGPARDIVRGVARDRPLVELFTLHQRRAVRDVTRLGRRVAILSLDHVWMDAPGSQPAYELEIELTPFGRLSDVRALQKLLEPYALRPQPLSKFERGLALVEGRGNGSDPKRPAARRRAKRPPNPAIDTPPSAAARRKSRKKGPGVRSSDPMTEAGRKILRFHFERMLEKEPGTRAGVDAEELHDMRVATRRQRAAVRIVGPHFRRKAIRPIRDGLRVLGGRLGAVRDLDVLIGLARNHQAELQPAEAQAFQSLIEAWTERRDAARAQMIDHLDSQEYATFKETAGTFLDTPGAGMRRAEGQQIPRPLLVANVVPAEIWAHYGALSAFAPVLPWASVETLHALRIECKRLRYVLEFFREALDPCADEAIAAIVALQDHLGELQDAAVAIGLVRDFLAGSVAATQVDAAAAAGRYLDSRAARLDELRHSIEKPWAGVAGPGFKSCLARAVAAM